MIIWVDYDSPNDSVNVARQLQGCVECGGGAYINIHALWVCTDVCKRLLKESFGRHANSYP